MTGIAGSMVGANDVPGKPRIVWNGSTEIATEAFGDAGDPPLLMIMGATASMLWWPDELCLLLAARGRFVVRFDNRDTGQSFCGPPGAMSYTIDDMAGDAVAVLDAYGIARAHFVGMSLGGMLGQLAAIRWPERVETLTAIGSACFDEDDPTLDPIDPALIAHFGTVDAVDWTDRDAVVAFFVTGYRIAAGAGPDFDEDRARLLAGREFDRARNPRSALNHALLKGGDAWRGRLRSIVAPTLVIHGRRDPVNSFRHGCKLAEAIPGARLVALDLSGHELNERDWPRIVEEILVHTAGDAGARAGS